MAKQLEEAELEPLKQEASLETTDPVDQKLDLAEPPHDKEEGNLLPVLCPQMNFKYHTFYIIID